MVIKNRLLVFVCCGAKRPKRNVRRRVTLIHNI